MLVRNGVGRVRLIDFDQVTVSSLNRHSNATREDVGLPKTQVLRSFLLRICPFCDIEVRESLFSEANAAELLDGSPDFVLDCIDNIDTKVALLRYCKENNIRVMSAMGAGAKSDPSKIIVGDISETQADPLSKAVRVRLRKCGIEAGIPTVFSLEVPKVKLIPLEEEQAKQALEFQLIPDFRIRILPVLGPLPAMFGNAMATYVLQALCGYEVPLTAQKAQSELAKRMFQQFHMKERDTFKQDPKNVPFDLADVSFILEEIWRYRSPLSRQVNHLTLERWDRSKPSTLDNVVVLTVPEAKKHAALASLEEYPPEVRAFIEAKFRELHELDAWRR